MSFALRIANDSENSHKHGAVLVKSGRVLAFAPNIFKNSPNLFEVIYPDDIERRMRDIRDHCSVHAEARVVKMVGDDARGSTVYVARVNKHGAPLLSKPCSECQKTLAEAGVKAVIYTDYYEGFSEDSGVFEMAA